MSRRLLGLARPAGLVLAVLAASALLCWLRLVYCPPLVDIDTLVAGTGYTPFQHRILVPLIALGLKSAFGVAPRTTQLAVEFASVAAVMLVAAWQLRRWRIPVWWLAVLFYILVVNYVVSFGYSYLECYDLPALLFSLLLTLALYHRRIGACYLLLPLALLNRETAVFMTVLFAVVERDMPRSRLAGHVAAQLVLFVAIKAALLWAFRHNPGPGALSLYVGDFAGAGGRAWADLRIVHNLSGLVPIRALCVFGGLWLPVLLWCRRISIPFFRRALGLVPIVFAIVLVVGNLTEFRVYTELVPIMFFALVLEMSAPVAA